MPMPISALLERPAGLEPFDESLMRDGYYRDFGRPKARMPQVPIVPSLGRPAAGGDALELADLALSRGDAFDASAQYRALLPKVHASASVYVTLQLARAYRALGDLERAVPLLESTANGTGSSAWVAIAELAELRASEIGGVAAVRELAPRAGRRAELVVDHLIHILPDEEAALLLLDKAVRLSQCEFAAQAYLLDPGLAEDEKAPCVLAANEVRYRAVVVERVEGLVEYYDHLAPFVARWEALADAARGGSRDAEPWLV
ncbi:MAG TPA: hypothetical protein VM261_18010, partial [Kofleriaceae bacterium]|nr:hypothetical protein [Kofleriaceae bacterium]